MSDSIRQLYQTVHDGSTQPLAIPEPWLALAVHPGPSPLRPGARVLVAGCGSGNELLGLAARSDLALVGVDFSVAAVALARERLGPQAEVVAGDLTDPGLAGQLGRFDAILCNAVADYVPDQSALFRTLADCLEPHGVCVVGSNRPDHPRAAVLQTLQTLGLDQTDPAAVRAALATVDAARPEAAPLAQWPDGLVAMDLTVPFAHHQPLADQAAAARKAGLHLFGTLSGPRLLPALPDALLPGAMAAGLDGLALLYDQITLDGARTALYTAQPAPTPPFADPRALLQTVPTADPALTRLAPLSGDPTVLRPVTIPLEGFGTWSATLPAWVLEVLRRSDGHRPLDALLDGLPQEPTALAAGLFRAWAIALVRFA